MAVSRLSLYNNALIMMGERPLTSVYENRSSRTTLDEVYALQLIESCLELAQPRFAHITAKLASPVVSAVHSLDSVYYLPADYIGIVGLYSDEALENEVERRIIQGLT